ncbi:MAG: rRNA pseudouridine synthase [Ruminococcaceae bacterium]|nr:rRNA pseudouridine synthase [Oscillospiraceae bacterium]
MKRLDKLLSDAGAASRRELKDIIKKGRVTVNGIVALSGDMKVEETAVITLDGEPVNSTGLYYIMLNKPAGCVSATEDRDKTVLDLLPAEMKRAGVFPVGRLDKDTEGLLLLTNDGAWAHGITSPKKHVSKRYRALVEGLLTESDAELLSSGIELKDGTKCLPAKLEIENSGNTSRCVITITEGKYHQVKRMMAAVGHRVLYLERISIGELILDPALERGQWRKLEVHEIDTFRR